MIEEIIHRFLDGESDVLDGRSNNHLGLSTTPSLITEDKSGDDGNTIGSMGFTQRIQNEFIPLLKDEDAFDVFINCLTCPKKCLESEEDDGVNQDKANKQDNKDDQNNKHIKRSFRAMTILVNDTIAAQQLHQQIGISNIANMSKKQQAQFDEEKIYKKFLLSPTRAVLLAKKIFQAYQLTYENFSCKYDGMMANNIIDGQMRYNENNIHESVFACDANMNMTKKSNTHNMKAKQIIHNKNFVPPHLPHLNKTLAALLAAYPKQVILASCSCSSSTSSSSATSSSSENVIQQTLEPMLNLQTFCSDYSSPMQTLVDIIIMGCTGKKRDNSNLQSQQQAMMMAAAHGGEGLNSMNDPVSIMNQVYIGCTHRKKFVRSLSSWGLVQHFVNVIASHSSMPSTNLSAEKKGSNGEDVDDTENNTQSIYNEHVAESTCDGLIAIMEFICFPQQLHPALAMNGGGANLLGGSNESSKDKKEESAGEEDLFRPLTNVGVISQLANCANYHQKFTDVNATINTTKEEETSKEVPSVATKQENAFLLQNQNSADASSRTLLGLFEIATGKARRILMNPTLETAITGGDDGDIECKVQNDDQQSKELPGIDDNKLLKAGITFSMHSTLVSNIGLIVKAMDIRTQPPPPPVKDNDKVGNEGSSTLVDSPLSTAVIHPGRYTIERPFTSRRLDLITLFADILSYEDHNDDAVNRTAAIKAMDILSELPFSTTNEERDDSKVYSPWSGLCDYLFDYPENSLYGIQFYRILHAICMTNHEITLKTVIQKCKFLSKAIKECKNKSSGSNRGVLLKCLNALRLHSQSIGPHCFLRHYFDSHDGWRAFESDLKKMTLEQQLPGGGIAVPKIVNNQIAPTEAVPITEIDIDLGSPYAADIGFPSCIKPYTNVQEEFEVVLTEKPSLSPGKKKKKNNKNKKKKKK